ncbi:MAG TPA: hypothetical protein VFU81_10735, partial [Thermomicrobiales bacterium]|nr:hypothetical protein [Thermomicrobiales bacterium]
MAPETAAKMGLKASPQQPPAAADGQLEHETREQIETLLARFVSEHQAELEADLARHGDPRTARGYTRKKRLAELEQLRRRQIARESQRDDAGKLNQLIEKLRKKVATAKDDPRALLRLDRDRRRLRELVNMHRSHAADDLLPEMREALQAAETFMQSCPQLFAQGVTDDPQLNARFEALKNAGGAPAMLNQLREGAARMAPEMAAKMGLKAAPQQAPAAADGQLEHETREQIETLLARFVSEHQAELEADLARHGDP